MNRAAITWLLACAALSACKRKANQPAATPPARTVQIHFVAKVNGAPFRCGGEYPNVGTTKAKFAPQDFRAYVSAVQLLDDANNATDVALANDGRWQNGRVALLDFEDKTGLCQNGTPETNARVVGQVTDSNSYKGLTFRIAVPFADNHNDASTAAAPLDQMGMFWGWQGGYKFFSLEGRVNDAHPFVAHVGSTGCAMSTPNQVTSCLATNEIFVQLPHFDPTHDVVVFDLGTLLETSALTQANGATLSRAGCMAEANNPSCAPLFARMGLAADRQAAQPAAFVSVETAAAQTTPVP